MVKQHIVGEQAHRRDDAAGNVGQEKVTVAGKERRAEVPGNGRQDVVRLEDGRVHGDL